ncbi:MAG: NAD+ synthase [Acetobacterales bacterium]
MTDRLAIAIAQMNPTVGDVEGNLAALRAVRRRAAEAGADLVVTPELVTAGYPPEDLVLKPMFQERIEQAVRDLAAETSDGGPAMLVGSPWREEGCLYNAALLLDGGRIAAVRFKYDLPNYGVFDEKRVFTPGPLPGPVNFRDVRLGVMVCEDMWSPDVAECLGESGAEILIVPNGSPFEIDKSDERLNLAVARVTETRLPLLYVNQVGGQDELVFDGSSFVLNLDCSLAAKAASWTEDFMLLDWQRQDDTWVCEKARVAPEVEGVEAIYFAMVTGLRDYVGKNRFPGVIIGLSGGIDSALSAAVAVDALGPEQVTCVMMPSPYTSEHSLEDAAQAARSLGTRLLNVPIWPAMEAFDKMLEPSLGGASEGVTRENIQPRARALVLMALSNHTGSMLLTTGNKSEMSVGYATLYGDMCGGFSVLKDVYKTTVYQLSEWRNQARSDGLRGPGGRVIPQRIISKAPSAELKPDQTDQDSLPPYDKLDAVLHCLIESELSFQETVDRGFEPDMVRRVWMLLDRAEYKRRQAPPGVKISRRAFGRDRRYPITNAFTAQL